MKDSSRNRVQSDTTLTSFICYFGCDVNTFKYLANIDGYGPSHVETPKLVAPTRTNLLVPLFTTRGPPLSP